MCWRESVWAPDKDKKEKEKDILICESSIVDLTLASIIGSILRERERDMNHIYL